MWLHLILVRTSVIPYKDGYRSESASRFVQVVEEKRAVFELQDLPSNNNS